MITEVVTVMREKVFEQWALVVLAALGFFLIWRSRSGSMASSASAIGWALLVMVLVTMVGRWPVLAGHAADQAVTSTIGAVTAGLHGQESRTTISAGAKATAGMHQSLLYQAWLGGTFGSANSDVAVKYGPVIFASTALTWGEAKTLADDPAAGAAIIEAKEQAFEDTAALIADADPDAYDYLTGKRSDTRVGYAVLAGVATAFAVPFLFVSALLVLGALIIVRFGVMLFPGVATLGLFPTMRHLVTGIGSTVVAALINAVVFGIGSAVTVLGMGVLLAPTTGIPGWLSMILMLVLTVVMWVALRPFRRLTQMVGVRNHFSEAAGGVTETGRSSLRLGRRVLTAAATSFVGVAGAAAAVQQDDEEVPPAQVQRAEAASTYQPAAIETTAVRSVQQVAITEHEPVQGQIASTRDEQAPAAVPPASKTPVAPSARHRLDPDEQQPPAPSQVGSTRFEAAAVDGPRRGSEVEIDELEQMLRVEARS